MNCSECGGDNYAKTDRGYVCYQCGYIMPVDYIEKAAKEKEHLRKVNIGLLIFIGTTTCFIVVRWLLYG